MKDELQQLIDEGLSSYQIATKLEVPRSTIQSRLKKFGIKSNSLSFSDKPKSAHSCSRCGCTDVDKFYGHKKYICAECFKKESLDRFRKNKKMAVDLLGSSCSRCGYNKSVSALEFHHSDPSVKDPKFSNMSHWSFARIKDELNTCVLLCSNCHRELHDELRLTDV